jgi:hypothetical protein
MRDTILDPPQFEGTIIVSLLLSVLPHGGAGE